MPGLSTLGNARLYWETLRHLRLRQVVGRIGHRLLRPRPSLAEAPPLRRLSGVWTAPTRRPPSMTGPTEFTFLNERHDLDVVGWDNPALDKLWRYNLHYFEDLAAQDAAARGDWHSDLIERWIAENPVGSGTGWEPYPTSLRIVNWTKWALAGNDLSPKALQSLAIQGRWLSRRLEHHILGNHLFANAKALLFAGLFFDGKEAKGWAETALDVLSREIPEQILTDGGQFERSTMYHSLALEDVLDLVNLAAAFPDSAAVSAAAAAWRALIPAMLGWLAAMSHSDGDIAFFNDAAIGIASSPDELRAYAIRLDIGIPQSPVEEVTHLPASGYVRVEKRDMVAILDVAPVGPDYLPGHAHADTLSFELSVGAMRVLVNSGTSLYGLGAERARQRGTAAHNTVVVDGKDSSEVWAGFRVARRARPFDLTILADDGPTVACSHDGYRRLPGGPVHRRQWRFGGDWLAIEDALSGPEYSAQARYHVHPQLDLRLAADGRSGAITNGDRPVVLFEVMAGRARLERTTYHPNFGVTLTNRCLVLELQDGRAGLRLSVVPDTV